MQLFSLGRGEEEEEEDIQAGFYSSSSLSLLISPPRIQLQLLGAV